MRSEHTAEEYRRMELLSALGLALLPGFGNMTGGLVGEFVKLSGRRVNQALHAAAGIVLAVVAVELMPTALEGAPGWAIAISFAFGGLAATALRGYLEHRDDEGKDSAGLWMIYAAVAMDLFSDGLMIGTGAAVSADLALVLALGQVTADVPEGFASVAGFREAGLSRRRRLLISISYFIPVIVGALMGFLLLRDRPEWLQMSALVFTAGVLVVAAVEDMMEEAHKAAEDRKGSAIFFVGGFALFVLISSYLG